MNKKIVAMPTLGSKWIERHYGRRIQVVGYANNKVLIASNPMGRRTKAKPERFGRDYKCTDEIKLLPQCACGGVPTRFGCDLTQGTKWAQAWPDCCGEWSFEFRTSYQTNEIILEAMAIDAWRRLPRGWLQA